MRRCYIPSPVPLMPQASAGQAEEASGREAERAKPWQHPQSVRPRSSLQLPGGTPVLCLRGECWLRIHFLWPRRKEPKYGRQARRKAGQAVTSDSFVP